MQNFDILVMKVVSWRTKMIFDPLFFEYRNPAIFMER